MRSISNQQRIARGARLGKILTLGSMGLLLAGLILAWRAQPVFLLLALACLLLGMLAASIGLYHMSHWVREPRADQALEQALKGLDDSFRLYNYILPAPHVLLSPSGLYVLTALGQDGAIRFEQGRFRRRFSVWRLLRFLAEEGLGKPLAEGDAQVRALRQFLAKHGVAEGIDIQNVLVFYNPRAQLQVTDAPRPVVVPKGLKRAIRRGPETRLPPALYSQLGELFDGQQTHPPART